VTFANAALGSYRDVLTITFKVYLEQKERIEGWGKNSSFKFSLEESPRKNNQRYFNPGRLSVNLFNLDEPMIWQKDK
jgi:hypothetical protein